MAGDTLPLPESVLGDRGAHNPVRRAIAGVVRRLRDAHAAQVELQEQVWLRQEPWLEDLLHWSNDGGEWRLHGCLLPDPGARRRSVTRGGWCPHTSPAR